jgi:2-amino-4-hydroxy-6-hydroxymethyldihydropteridine diphosphokinase
MNVGIGLGSNLGSRIENLRSALSWLQTMSQTPVRYSQVYETSPIDCPEGTPTFLNAVCEITYQGDLSVLLRKMRTFERERGRPSVYSKNTPRFLDLDILYADDQIIKTEELTIPHPRMLERRFVLQPLNEIHSDLIVPNTTQTIQTILSSLRDSAEVKLFPEKLR